MITKSTKEELKKQLKRMYFDEFNDPNESFMDFLLDLSSKNNLINAIKKGRKYYYSNFDKYK